jgi:hypothetical protein
MANITSFDLVDFLIDRKFKFAGAIGGRSVTISAARRAKTDPQLAKEIAAYKVHLWQLSPKEFEALLDSERVQERAELEVRVEREERERFFNQPNAEAELRIGARPPIGPWMKQSLSHSAKHLNW